MALRMSTDPAEVVALKWDPALYGRYADERGRPYVDLLARVEANAPRRVVDVGCGPGNLTALLPTRWPDAVIEGFDSSPEMISAAGAVPGVRFSVGDAATWMPTADTDVIISNAVLQWLPAHRSLLRDWADALPNGGWLAFQVPGYLAPWNDLMIELARSSRWASRLADAIEEEVPVSPARDYAQLLLEAGLTTDAWETTYQHVLTGEDAVLEWVRGTALRPLLAALGADAPEFERQYAAALREAYPTDSAGRTLFGFHRIFAVGHKP